MKKCLFQFFCFNLKNCLNYCNCLFNDVQDKSFRRDFLHRFRSLIFIKHSLVYT
uniref:Uncharacterized protein n=1 Tax=Ciona intestinalis TaxID=7719 RepID=H2Y0E2_CIOIN